MGILNLNCKEKVPVSHWYDKGCKTGLVGNPVENVPRVSRIMACPCFGNSWGPWWSCSGVQKVKLFKQNFVQICEIGRVLVLRPVGSKTNSGSKNRTSGWSGNLEDRVETPLYDTFASDGYDTGMDTCDGFHDFTQNAIIKLHFFTFISLQKDNQSQTSHSTSSHTLEKFMVTIPKRRKF